MRHEINTTAIKKIKEKGIFYDDSTFNNEYLDILVNEHLMNLEVPNIFDIQNSADEYFYEEDFKNTRKLNKEKKYLKEFDESMKSKQKSLDRAVSIWNYLAIAELHGVLPDNIIEEKLEADFYYLDDPALGISINDFHEICFKAEELNKAKQIWIGVVIMKHFEEKHGQDQPRDKKLHRINAIMKGFSDLNMFERDKKNLYDIR